MSLLVIVGLLVVGVVVVASVAVFLLMRALDLDFDSDADSGWGDLFAPEATEFPRTGSLPMSTRLQQSVYRLHPAQHLHTGRSFPRTFEDGPWKWDERQRYAPAGVVSGHFFALARDGATAEAAYYALDRRDRVMLEVELDLDDVLDLRWEPNIRAVLSDFLVEPLPPAGLLWFLRALVHEETGGNLLTDEIGVWAQEHGYRGVLFFGARSIERHRTSFEGTGDRQLGLPVAGGVFAQLREDPASTNLVAYSGVELVRSIRRHRDGPEAPWTPNEYFGADPTAIDAELEYGSDYRRERSEIIRLAGQRTFSLEWDGRVEEVADG